MHRSHLRALIRTAIVGAATVLAPLPGAAPAAAQAGGRPGPASPPTLHEYFDTAGQPHSAVLGGGVRMIPIETPSGTFRVWTKRVGNNPRIKLLLLHGGPGLTHEYFEGADSWLPTAGVEYYYYDQLGSAYSDQPDDTTLWNIPRFVEEVEQVRKALGLDSTNFFLLGHSWGGILAMEYALKYQKNLKGLIISNMMASAPAYDRYAHEVLMPAMNQDTLRQILALEESGRTDDPRYMALLMPSHYTKHVLRMPPDQWPEPVMRAMSHLNPDIYVRMQGPSELGISGTLEDWDRSADLQDIRVPTLVIGSRYDTMDPDYMRWMAGQVQHGRFLYAPNGSHLDMYDDQATWFTGLIRFLEDVDTRTGP